MEYKKFLTNEKVSKKFKSQFELVNYAIRLAENMILSGREGRVKTDSQNHALQVVAEINCNKDQFEIIPSQITASEETDFRARELEERKTAGFSLSEKKRARKAAGG